MMQFKVPQDVLRPDKIVGFLTLRQLVIVGLGAGLCYSLYMILSKQYLIEIWLPPVVLVALVTGAFAFFRYHDLPFEKMILAFAEYKLNPQVRVWQKMHGDTVLSVLADVNRHEIIKTKEKVVTELERRKKLEEVSNIVDAQATKFKSHELPQDPTPEQNFQQTPKQ
ncbi:MAG: PrgI family protein [Candidatus Gracilibacteria bacterium]|jgi:hypothetical protein